MKIRFGAACLLAGLGLAGAAAAQVDKTPYTPANHPVNIHLAEAQKAAGLDYPGLLARVCVVPPGGGDAAAGARRAGGVNGLSAAILAAPVQAQIAPPLGEWYQRPQQVFDNFYWIGIKRNSAWLIKTSEGLIVIDSLFHYAAEPSMVAGIRKLGMDPKDVKYILITHGHGDHDEGAKTFQDLGAKVVMSQQDWDLIINGPAMPGGKPRRDMVGTDGQKLTLGDTTITMYQTPGHTDGTMSFIFNVKDKGQRRIVAYPGGTAYNFPRTISRFQQYVDTQKRFAKIAADAGASVLFTNHSEFDMAYQKVRMMSSALPEEGNPFIFKDSVKRYFDVMVECSEAEKWRLMTGLDTPQQ